MNVIVPIQLASGSCASRLPSATIVLSYRQVFAFHLAESWLRKTKIAHLFIESGKNLDLRLLL